MKSNLTQRLAALAAAVTVTFSVVWAHASLAYPAVTPAALMAQAQACRG
jgi:hypothetical protein